METIPDEILYQILSWVDTTTLPQLVLVSRRITRIVKDQYFPSIISLRVKLSSTLFAPVPNVIRSGYRWMQYRDSTMVVNGTLFSIRTKNHPSLQKTNDAWEWRLSVPGWGDITYKTAFLMRIYGTNTQVQCDILGQPPLVVAEPEKTAIFTEHCDGVMNAPWRKPVDWPQATRKMLEAVTGDPHILRRLMQTTRDPRILRQSIWET